MESGERGILPLDSSGTLEIGGIQVDVGGKDAQSARYAGWRIAQRAGLQGALGARRTSGRSARRPTCRDYVLDSLVSSIMVEQEQIGPNRYIATLASCSTARGPRELLGVAGRGAPLAPMLLIPVMITGGTATSVELRNPWQRAWAQFRTSPSPIDYVRVSGLGVDPLLVNAAQTRRPGRGWWRNVARPIRGGQHPGRRGPSSIGSTRAARARRRSSAGVRAGRPDARQLQADRARTAPASAADDELKACSGWTPYSPRRWPRAGCAPTRPDHLPPPPPPRGIGGGARNRRWRRRLSRCWSSSIRDSAVAGAVDRRKSGACNGVDRGYVSAASPNRRLAACWPSVSAAMQSELRGQLRGAVGGRRICWPPSLT